VHRDRLRVDLSDTQTPEDALESKCQLLCQTLSTHILTAPTDRDFVVFCCSLAVLPIFMALLLFVPCYFSLISLEQINDAFCD
jgi:hypothetical protein